MRVGLDLTPLASPVGGIGRFVSRLAAAVAAADDFELVPIALSGRSGGEIRRRLAPVGVAVGRSLPAAPLLRAWGTVDHPSVERLFGRMDVVHGTNFYAPASERPTLVSIHDLTPWDQPESQLMRRFARLAERAVGKGAHVHVLSRTTGAEVAERLGIDPQRLHPVHLGVDPVPDSELPAEWRERLGGRPFALGLGAQVRRKRWPELVESLARTADLGLDLVIAGRTGDDTERLRVAVTAAREDLRVHTPGAVSDDVRAALLRQAAVVVSAAETEGFGLVPIEAMSAGTPVVARIGGAIEEVCGDAALLVPPGDDLAEAIERALVDSSLRATLVERGRRRATELSWSSCTERMLALYRRLAP